MKAYKVIRRSTRESAIVFGNASSYYPVGVKVKPKENMPPIFAFKTREDAHNWVGKILYGEENLLIVEATVTLSKTKFRYMKNQGWWDSLVTLQNWWKKRGTAKFYEWDMELVSGTILCSSITCVE